MRTRWPITKVEFNPYHVTSTGFPLKSHQVALVRFTRTFTSLNGNVFSDQALHLCSAARLTSLLNGLKFHPCWQMNFDVVGCVVKVWFEKLDPIYDCDPLSK